MKLKVLLLSLIVFILCGCQSKFNGTWCLYEEVPSSLIILDKDINDDNLKKITDYLDKISDLSSYDIIDNIESASKMINVYYIKKDNIENYKNDISKLNGVYSFDNKMINKAKEKIIIKGKYYTYDKELNTLYASEIKGKTKKNKNSILIGDIKFFYKDSFLCADSECNVIFSKSNNDCN